jgi:hypothetical protein
MTHSAEKDAGRANVRTARRDHRRWFDLSPVLNPINYWRARRVLPPGGGRDDDEQSSRG